MSDTYSVKRIQREIAMSKPEDVTDEAWDAARAVLGHPGVLVSASCYQRIAEQSARAIMAAEEGAAAKIERMQKERDYAVVWANRSVAQVKEGIDALENMQDILIAALTDVKRFAEATRLDPQANVPAILAIANGALEKAEHAAVRSQA